MGKIVSYTNDAKITSYQLIKCEDGLHDNTIYKNILKMV